MGPWERLFASSRDGQSFGTFMRRVRGHSQTIVVAKTSDGRIVGGYATDVWSGRKQPSRTEDDASHAFLFVVEQPDIKTDVMIEAGNTFLRDWGNLARRPRPLSTLIFISFQWLLPNALMKSRMWIFSGLHRSSTPMPVA